MSTRSRIGIENEDETIESVYCHWDGYIDHVGTILFNNYRETRKILRLMQHGDISSIGKDIGRKHLFDNPYSVWNGRYEKLKNKTYNMCTFYKRDRDEKDVESTTVKNFEEYLKLTNDSWGNYAYLWTKNKKWVVAKVGDGTEDNIFYDLKDKVGAKEYW